MQRRIERIEKCIQQLEAFDPQSVGGRYNIPEVTALETAISGALDAAFGTGTPRHDLYEGAARLDQGPHTMRVAPTWGRGSYDTGAEEAREAIEARQYLAEGKARSLVLLRQAIETLRADLEDMTQVQAPAAPPQALALDLSKVFIVHGRDDGLKEQVARQISEKFGLRPVILHERPNKGRSLITKFQEEADGIGFAIVLMSPDDEGGLAGADSFSKRARQNVVFELGFFIGKLGPSRVAALVKGDVERPSDFDGVVYISYDQEDWKVKLGQELKEAGYAIDWNKVMAT